MSRSRLRVLLTALCGSLVMALVAGCGVQGFLGLAEPPPPPPSAKVIVDPAGSEVSPSAPITASVKHGRFLDVQLAHEDGTPVPGELAPDGKQWKATEQLAYGGTYHWAGKARGADGSETPVRGTFSTVAPDRVVNATVTPSDGQEVGVAMPISVRFDEPVTDKAAVERALKVTPSEPVEGSWAWLSDEQVDWRPKDYWPAHTHVDVEANLYGVPFGEGAFGEANVTSSFDIGRHQLVKADVNSLRLVVEQDGEEVANYPTSYGRLSDPNLHTPNGTFIVMAKFPVENMSNPAYGYENVMKSWAVRISNHGEYIHENAENGNIGYANTTHGCINLTAADAKHYYDSALIGDPVEVTGSPTTMEPGYDVYNWLLSWEEWQEKSAL